MAATKLRFFLYHHPRLCKNVASKRWQYLLAQSKTAKSSSSAGSSRIGAATGAVLLSAVVFSKSSEEKKEDKHKYLHEDKEYQKRMKSLDKALGENAELSQGLLTNLYEKADILYDVYLIDQLFELLVRFAKKDEAPAELLWRMARATCEKGKLCKHMKEKNDYFEEAMGYIEKALERPGGEQIFAVHKWWGIILNYTSELEGYKSQIGNSPKVRTHFEKALELNPKDPTTWHLLGMWHYSFADLSFFERKFAAVLFGEPPNSTYEEALKCFLEAEKLEPGFYSRNLLYIAMIYEKSGEKEKAARCFEQAFRMPMKTVDDKEVHEKAYHSLLKLGKDYSNLF